MIQYLIYNIPHLISALVLDYYNDNRDFNNDIKNIIQDYINNSKYFNEYIKPKILLRQEILFEYGLPNVLIDFLNDLNGDFIDSNEYKIFSDMVNDYLNENYIG
jgi:hypothetical protein